MNLIDLHTGCDVLTSHPLASQLRLDGGKSMKEKSKDIKKEIKKELSKTLRDFENMKADVEELYEILCKIEENWKEIIK